MDVIPAISTARHEPPRRNPDRVKQLREMPYADYLQTPEWRRTRDRAIRLAGWTCMRCPANRTLQVHHKTYERLGEERDGDLEVLCSPCHEGVHIDEDKEIRGIYAVVVARCLDQERFTCLADLLEAVKVQCARAKIPYDGSKVWRAVKLLDANRHGVIDAPKPYRHRPPPAAVLEQPIEKAEAASLLRALNIRIPFRSFPAANLITQREADMRKAMEIVGQAMLDSVERCRQLEAKAKA